MSLDNFDDNLVASHAIFTQDPAAQQVFEPLRRSDPLHYTVTDSHPPFWAVTTQKDIMEIGRRNDMFLNAPMSFLLSNEELARRQAETGGKAYLRALTHMDEPDHKLYRSVTQSWFMPANLKRLEATIQQVVSNLLDRMQAMDGECDFADDIAPWLPLQVIMGLLGIPQEDHAYLLKLTQHLLAPQDPDQKRENAATGVSVMAQVVADYQTFFREVVADRRARPTDDLSSVIANMRIGDQPAPELETISYFVTLATAGHDTTYATLAGGLLELTRHPEQFERLRADPALAASAAEEMFRWVSPIKHFVRTANADVTLRDKQIRAGDRLMLCYPSANRDEDVFEDPGAFRIDRTPNRHLAFGSGVHSCLGQHLARMEVRTFFREFVRRVEHIELTGPFAYVASNRASGPKRMPVRYRFF
ncbi:cytochrome P450 [Hydrogenophaga sp.]|uniref:cytochrome P450 n=1 Tax=Hydrogenophaga sp. TaxID=1904254 RepID=UPI00260999A7|nr:cytochrome P450 [Hydrogenophaga sp.]MCW5652190.1 cytochrome P450 [Hydrogenophaga sp.]